MIWNTPVPILDVIVEVQRHRLILISRSIGFLELLCRILTTAVVLSTDVIAEVQQPQSAGLLKLPCLITIVTVIAIMDIMDIMDIAPLLPRYKIAIIKEYLPW